jgi:hypothetical protein
VYPGSIPGVASTKINELARDERGTIGGLPPDCHQQSYFGGRIVAPPFSIILGFRESRAEQWLP